MLVVTIRRGSDFNLLVSVELKIQLSSHLWQQWRDWLADSGSLVEPMASRFGSLKLVALMRDARVFAETQMSVFESEGENWNETSITYVLMTITHPLARMVKFNQVEEGVTGADWLWWWIDETTGEAFGAAVQAKRLKQKSSKWWIDFGYKDGKQRRDLEFLGDYFNVVPLYALWLGTSNYRQGAFCRAKTHTPDCEECRKSTLSAVPSILTGRGADEYDSTDIALGYHVSLENLVDPDTDPGTYWSPNFANASDALVRFLNEPQAGSRQIARTIVDQIRDARQGMFSLATDEAKVVKADAVFPEVPDDQGHFDVPYFAHVLRGLRTTAPDYVREFLETGYIQEDIRTLLGGMAVFTIRAED